MQIEIFFVNLYNAINLKVTNNFVDMKKIKLLLLVLCAAVISGVSTDSAQAKTKKMGLQLYSVRSDIGKDLQGTLKAVADMGYKQAELASYGNGKFYNTDPKAFRKMVKGYGMKIISSHIGRGLNKEKYDEDMAWWDEAIKAHKAAGIKYMVMPSPPNRMRTMEDLQDMCMYLNDIGARCKAAGIKFGYHNHSQEFTKVGDVVPYEYFLVNTDPKLVIFQLDVYWAQRGGYDPATLILKHPSRIRMLHIKDEKEIGASGYMNFKAIYDAAYSTGIRVFTVEQEAYSGPVFESVKASFDYLNNASYVK